MPTQQVRALPPRVGTASLEELQLLRAAVEGGLDGMVVVAADGRILTFNRRFQEIWPIPAEVAASGSDEAALASVLDKLVDPDAFLSRVRELYARAAGTARDELLLLDGRVLDRFGTALHDDAGAYIGWAWYFRDVTEEHSAAQDAGRLGSLVSVAQSLGEARDEEDVLTVVAGQGAAILGASGAALCLLGEPGLLRVLTTSDFDDDLRAEVAQLPVGLPLPAVHCATTGEALFLTDLPDVLVRFPAAQELYERARTRGSAYVPLNSTGGSFGALALSFGQPHPWRAADRDLLQALAALTAQTLERLRARQAEHQAAAAVRRLSETLQRSLLTAPRASDGMRLAVRYQPAAQEAQVGGDWYDAFVTRPGLTTLVVGDVAGHDRDAAAAMAQVRNVLRGVAQSVDDTPGAVLGGLDRALERLGVSTLATAVLCQVRPLPGGSLQLDWCNAGHPPPLLVHPDGHAELLDRAPEVMLGITPSTLRQDHRVVLAPGATLVLCTDGLVERRGQDLDVGVERLRATAAELHHLPPDELCDALLARLAAGAEDDVALLVLHVGGASC